MSDAPQAPGWWQASDGKWYPPAAAPPPISPPAFPTPPAPVPGPYGQPGAYYPPGTYAAPPKTDGLAIASLVLSISGIVFIVACFGIVGTLAGFFMGLASRSRIEKSNGQLTGSGLAMAGLILGAVGTVLYIVFIIVVAVSGGFDSTNA